MSGESGNMRSGLHKIPKAWRYVLGLMGVVILIAAFYGEENWRGRRAWERYKQESAKRGEPVEPSTLVPAPVPDDQNFAMTPFLAPLFDFFPGTQKWRDTNALAIVQNFPPDFNAAASEVKGSKGTRSNSWITAAIDLRAWNAALQKDSKSAKGSETKVVSNNLGTREAAEGVLACLAKYDPVIEELRAASARPYSRFNLRYDNPDPASVLLPHLAVLKRMCLLLQVRASAELAVGRPEQALADLNLIFSLADSIRNEPILISHLVRIAEVQIALQPLAEGLANHQWSDVQLAALEKRLSGFDFCAGGSFVMEGERVVFGGGIIDYVREARNRYGAVSGLGGASGNDQVPAFDVGAALSRAVPEGWFYLEKLNYNRIFEDDILKTIDVEAHRVNPEDSRRATNEIHRLTLHRGPGLVFRHRFFAAWLLPAVPKAAERTAYGQTAVDTARVACALERYRLAQGSYPETLEALAPRFMAKVPPDVITGQPLKYRRTDDGHYVLYSVGWNGTDDGGVVATNQSGQGVEAQHGDWVWR